MHRFDPGDMVGANRAHERDTLPADADLLFGQISVAQGFCTQDQLDRCLRVQAETSRPMPLGRHLVDEGFITEEQHSRVLEIQRKKLLVPDPVAGTRREASLFGRLVLRRGLLTEPQVNECLREQAQPGEARSLGEIMVARHLLSPAQVKELLGNQFKRIMSCPSCGLSYTVTSMSGTSTVECPRCRVPLRDGKPSDSVRTDAEIETRTAMSLQAEALRSAGTPPPARWVNTTCKVCQQPFRGVIDSTNRVNCPNCLTRFVVRRA